MLDTHKTIKQAIIDHDNVMAGIAEAIYRIAIAYLENNPGFAQLMALLGGDEKTELKMHRRTRYQRRYQRGSRKKRK